MRFACDHVCDPNVIPASLISSTCDHASGASWSRGVRQISLRWLITCGVAFEEPDGDEEGRRHPPFGEQGKRVLVVVDVPVVERQGDPWARRSRAGRRIVELAQVDDVDRGAQPVEVLAELVRGCRRVVRRRIDGVVAEDDAPGREVGPREGVRRTAGEPSERAPPRHASSTCSRTGRASAGSHVS